jgi:DNA-binding NtrC family response regulator
MSPKPEDSSAGRATPLERVKVVTVLSVSAVEADHRSLGNLFHHTKWTLLEAHNCAGAIEKIQTASVAVVICDTSLPDGQWTDLLRAISPLSCPPLMIVSCRLADERLWADAISAGAWDVLEKPFHQAELVRVVSLAWLAWKDQLQRRSSAAG